MKNIRDAVTMLGMLEDGSLSRDLSGEINQVLAKLRDLAGNKGKAKGRVTLSLDFEVEGSSTVINAAIASKTPATKRSSSFFFVTEDGLSTEHPRQLSFLEEQQEAAKRVS